MTTENNAESIEVTETQENSNESVEKDVTEMSDEEYDQYLASLDEDYVNTSPKSKDKKSEEEDVDDEDSADDSEDADDDESEEDDEDSSEDEKEDKPKDDKDKEEKKPEPKVWKLKVEGQEVEFDASDDNKTREFVQKGLASEYRFREAAQMRREATDLVQTLKRNPLKVLTHEALGIDVEAFAEQIIFDSMLKRDNPEAYEKMIKERTDKQELEEYREQQRLAKEQKDKEEAEAKATQARVKHEQILSEQITIAIHKTKLPKEDDSLKQVAQVMFLEKQKGNDISPDDAAKKVEAQYLSWLKTQEPATPPKKPEPPKTKTPSSTKRKKPEKKYVSDNDFIARLLKD